MERAVLRAPRPRSTAEATHTRLIFFAFCAGTRARERKAFFNCCCLSIIIIIDASEHQRSGLSSSTISKAAAAARRERCFPQHHYSPHTDTPQNQTPITFGPRRKQKNGLAHPVCCRVCVMFTGMNYWHQHCYVGRAEKDEPREGGNPRPIFQTRPNVRISHWIKKKGRCNTDP